MRVGIAVTWLCATTLAACGGGNSHMSSSSPPPPGGGIPTPAQHTDVVTYKNDLARTGQNLTESVLALSNVDPSRFGLLRILAADGSVDATPLYLSALTVQGASHNVVFIATESDSVYAYDSDSGALLWRVSLLGAGETVNDLPSYGCQQVAPTIGITSTPVIDRGAGGHGIVYLPPMPPATSTCSPPTAPSRPRSMPKAFPTRVTTATASSSSHSPAAR